MLMQMWQIVVLITVVKVDTVSFFCKRVKRKSIKTMHVFGPGRQVQKATLVVLVISSLKIPLNTRRSTHIRAEIPHRSAVSL